MIQYDIDSGFIGLIAGMNKFVQISRSPVSSNFIKDS